MTTLFGFSWPQLTKVAVAIGVIASGAFVTGTYVQRLQTAEQTIASTETRLERVDDRLGFLAGEMRALRELVESAIRYSRLANPKDLRHDRSTVE